MTWRDRIRQNPASFRGAAFFLDSADLEVGRRVNVQRYPGRDAHTTRDLGRNPRSITINAYLIGDEYQDARDALLDAIEAAGPGTLVHPYYGRMEAVVTGPARVQESRQEGGFARVTFTLTRQSQAPALTRRPDTRGRLESARTAVTDGVRAHFVDTFDVVGMPSSHTDSALTALASATVLMRSAASEVTSAIGAANTVASEIDALADAAATIIDSPATLVDAIIDIGASIVGSARTVLAGFDRLTGIPDRVIDVFTRSRQTRATVDAMANLATFGADDAEPSRSTPLGEREADNLLAIHVAVRASAIAETAAGIGVFPVDSKTAATEIVEILRDQIDNLLLIAPDEVQGPLRDTMAALDDHLAQATGSLPDVGTYTPQVAMPALLIAHEIYGDARREAEIVARNAIANPVFVPARVPIEVLIDA